MVVEEKGTISIHTENIFPIIKKFLYSDQEIFLRELVSNAVDASQKITRLSGMGEFQGELGELKVKVSVDAEAKTITISDSGIGMSAEEVKKYINQIAFSGAKDFLEKFQQESKDQIIGQFGLGFYSAFMVAGNVEIITKSYREEEPAVRWECDGSTEFTLSPIDKAERGTDIILHINEDSEEFLSELKLKGILEKYCKFLPIPIEIGEETVNEVEPLWNKRPNTLKDEDYLEFYNKLYPGAEAPLFWIHLFIDSPFTLNGILYFPKIKNELEVQRHKVQLYSRQVFITDELKGIVPEFLTLLHGVIDSPDIPLNVSRSYLQADRTVKALNNRITSKVADKLESLFNENRADYETKWEALNLFVKYGILTEEKFVEKAKNVVLLETTEAKHYTINELTEAIKIEQTDKDGKVIMLYTSDVENQNFYVENAQSLGYKVIKLENNPVETHFIQKMETLFPELNISLKRVDSSAAENLIDKEGKIEILLSEADQKTLKEKAISFLGVNENSVDIQGLSSDSMPIQLVEDEFMRRFKEMYKMGGGDFGAQKVVLNANHPVIQKTLNLEEEQAKSIMNQLYDLALLSQNQLKGDKLTAFIKRSVNIVSE